jgi:hypothetical protein
MSYGSTPPPEVAANSRGLPVSHGQPSEPYGSDADFWSQLQDTHESNETTWNRLSGSLSALNTSLQGLPGTQISCDAAYLRNRMTNHQTKWKDTLGTVNYGTRIRMDRGAFTELRMDGLHLQAELADAEDSSVWTLAADQVASDQCKAKIAEAVELAAMLSGEYEAIRTIFDRFGCFNES